jgi:hypothetical protein
VDVDAAVALVQAQALRLQPEGDAFAFEHRLDRRRDFRILARDDARRHLDHGDAAAEAPVHLRELEADVAAADDDQVLRQKIDVHHPGAREKRHFSDAFPLGYRRTAARIDEDFRGFEHSAVDADLCAGSRSGRGLRSA